jgi:hypothetical protein
VHSTQMIYLRYHISVNELLLNNASLASISTHRPTKSQNPPWDVHFATSGWLTNDNTAMLPLFFWVLLPLARKWKVECSSYIWYGKHFFVHLCLLLWIQFCRKQLSKTRKICHNHKGDSQDHACLNL